MIEPSENIILIGMPGAGKSTLGVLLAKHLVRNFVDTDVMIQASEQKRLNEIIEAAGLDAFLEMESNYVRGLKISGTVIATGGSVVYRPESMEHLSRIGTIVFLNVPFDILSNRVGDMDARGVARRPDQTFSEIYHERTPLYRKYADRTVECPRDSHYDSIEGLLKALDN